MTTDYGKMCPHADYMCGMLYEHIYSRMQTVHPQMAEMVGVVPSMPRMNARQINRGNTPAESVEEYYKRNLLIRLQIMLSRNLSLSFPGCRQPLANCLVSFLLYCGKTSTSRRLWTCTKTIFPHRIMCLLNWIAGSIGLSLLMWYTNRTLSHRLWKPVMRWFSQHLRSTKDGMYLACYFMRVWAKFQHDTPLTHILTCINGAGAPL